MMSSTQSYPRASPPPLTLGTFACALPPIAGRHSPFKATLGSHPPVLCFNIDAVASHCQALLLFIAPSPSFSFVFHSLS